MSETYLGTEIPQVQLRGRYQWRERGFEVNFNFSSNTAELSTNTDTLDKYMINGTFI